jgi:P27 family predicted phage terminase small subunit
MAGRKPKPTALRVLQGNAGKRALPKHEPTPAAEPPPKPAHLTERAAAAWDRVAPELHRLGLLSVVDGLALELLVCAYDDWREAHIEVAAEGATYETETEHGRIVRAHPQVAIRSDAWRRVKSILAEFGLTPSSRARLDIEAPGQEDPMDAFLRGTTRGAGVAGAAGGKGRGKRA